MTDIQDYPKAQAISQAVEQILNMHVSDMLHARLEVCTEDDCETDETRELVRVFNEKMDTIDTIFHEALNAFSKRIAILCEKEGNEKTPAS